MLKLQLHPERLAGATSNAVSSAYNGYPIISACHCLRPPGFKAFYSALNLRHLRGNGALSYSTFNLRRGHNHTRARTAIQYMPSSQPAAPQLPPSHNKPPLPDDDTSKYNTLRGILAEDYDIELPKKPVLEAWQRMLCPSCEGGSQSELSFGVFISNDYSAVWRCHRATCGFHGSFHLDSCLRNLQRSKQPTNSNGSGSDQQFASQAAFQQATAPGQVARSSRAPVRPTPNFRDISQHPSILQWFSDRHISREALVKAGAQVEVLQGAPVVAFPHYKDQQLLNVSYVDISKCPPLTVPTLAVPPGASWQAPGAEDVVLGYDAAMALLQQDDNEGTLIIALGELELLAFYQAGIHNVIALPSSALQQPPAAAAAAAAVAPAGPVSQLAALDSCTQLLEKCVDVVIAAPNDAAGFALGEELARRIGKERCYRISWPNSCQENYRMCMEAHDMQQQQEPGAQAAAGQQAQLLPYPADVDSGFRCNALEVLAYDGRESLQYYCGQPVEYPVQGLHSFMDFYSEVYEYYMQQRPYDTGISSGWDNLDSMYRVVPGELTIVTGVPNSGKSEWLDALLVNLTKQHNWSFAMCSFEKAVTHHARQLLEKLYERPFWPRSDGGLSRQEVLTGVEWISERFHLIRFDDDRMPTIDEILDKARIAVLRYGIRGLVVDPYNELSHERPHHMSETEFVSQMLSKVKRFAQLYECHVWFVAHPRQLQDWQNRPPNLYDISGSANFINKADNGVVVHRTDWDNAGIGGRNFVHVLVRKVRNKAAGKIGDCYLEYKRESGVYVDVSEEDLVRAGVIE